MIMPEFIIAFKDYPSCVIHDETGENVWPSKEEAQNAFKIISGTEITEQDQYQIIEIKTKGLYLSNQYPWSIETAKACYSNTLRVKGTNFDGNLIVGQ